MRTHLLLLAVAVPTLGCLPAQQFTAIDAISNCRNATRIASGDLDSDGRLDLVVIGPPTLGSSLTTIWSRTPQGAWGDAVELGNSTSHAIVAELTGDNSPELLLTTGMGQPGMMVLSFSHHMKMTVLANHTWPMGSGGALAWLRGDGDAQPDLFTFGPSSVSFHRFLGNATFAPPVTTSILTGGSMDAFMADFTGDGYGDVAVVCHTPPSVRLHRGDGTGGFLPVVVTALAFTPSSSGIASELDGDGIGDLIVMGRPLLGTSSGTFVPSGPGLPIAFANDAGDCNGDGRADILSAGTIYLQQPGMTWAAGPTVPYWGNSENQFLLDADQDGRLDIVRLFHSNIGPVKGTMMISTPPATPPFVWPYGIGTPGCRGHVALTANADPTPGLASFALTATNAPAAAPGFVHVLPYVMSPVLQVHPALQLRLLVPPTFNSYTVPFHSNANGQAHLAIPIPPNTLGLTMQFQAFWLAPYGDGACSESPLGLLSSNGLHIQVH